MSSRCKGKRRLRSQGKETQDTGDATQNDFASVQGTSGSGRRKKPTKDVSKHVDRLPETTKNKQPKRMFDSVDENAKDRKGKKVKRSRKKAKTDNAAAVPENDEGIRYPIDLWFIISEYIDPESVGKFARICKDSLYVTETAGFWNSLYRRYFQADAALPESLQPSAMTQRSGLRARVIRALHYLHSPLIFKNAINPVPHSKMCNRQVVSQWYQVNRVCRHLIYYFKLKDIELWNDTEQEKSNLTDSANDITLNQEDGCMVVKIMTTKYVQLPKLVGMVLRDVSISASASTVCHMDLKFNCSTTSTTPNVAIDFFPVISYHLMNWWHPEYPHTEEVLPSVYDSDDE